MRRQELMVALLGWSFLLAGGSTAKVYATRWDRMVWVQITGGEPYFLSPAEPEAFVEAVHRIVLGQPELRGKGNGEGWKWAAVQACDRLE